MKQVRKRLSYANVMSSIAVFLVLGGATAFAAKKIGANRLKGSSVTTAKIKREAVAKGKIKRNAVDGSRVRDGSLTGADVDVATLATVPSAASAQPAAFARVSATGALDAANSKNVGSVTHVGAALYCFAGLPFTPRGGQATVDFNESQFQSTQFGLGDVKGTCPAGTQAFVFTLDNDDAAADPAAFFVVFYG